MKNLPFLTLVVLAASLSTAPGITRTEPLQLPRQRDLYFAENDLVYSRYLLLARDGTYRQINSENGESREVDVGTWQQTPPGIVELHFTRNALRYRALLSGPLSLIPNAGTVIDRLPTLAARIRRFLLGTTDPVFARTAANDLQIPSVEVVVSQGADTFTRQVLASMATQIDHFIESQRTHVYKFTLTRSGDSPLMLAQQDAVFQASDIPRVLRENKVRPGSTLPFFFTQVSEQTFARLVGTCQTLPLLGDSE